MRCAQAQIRIIKVHEVLAQITRDNFFSMKGQGQKLGVCWHKSQKTYFNMFQHRSQEIIFFYERTRTSDHYLVWFKSYIPFGSYKIYTKIKKSSTSRSGQRQNNGSRASTTITNFMEERKRQLAICTRKMLLYNQNSTNMTEHNRVAYFQKIIHKRRQID